MSQEQLFRTFLGRIIAPAILGIAEVTNIQENCKICLLRGSGRGKGSRPWNWIYSGSHGRRRRYCEATHTFRCRENGIEVVKEKRAQEAVSSSAFFVVCFCISLRYVLPAS